MSRLTLLAIALCLTGCDKDRGCLDNGTPHKVPDIGGWDIVTIMLVALFVAAVIEKYLEEKRK